jgi:hypothetical protein
VIFWKYLQRIKQHGPYPFISVWTMLASTMQGVASPAVDKMNLVQSGQPSHRSETTCPRVLSVIVTLTFIHLTPAPTMLQSLARKEGVTYFAPQILLESDHFCCYATSFTHLAYCNFSWLPCFHNCPI